MNMRRNFKRSLATLIQLHVMHVSSILSNNLFMFSENITNGLVNHMVESDSESDSKSIALHTNLHSIKDWYIWNLNAWSVFVVRWNRNRIRKKLKSQSIVGFHPFAQKSTLNFGSIYITHFSNRNSAIRLLSVLFFLFHFAFLLIFVCGHSHSVCWMLKFTVIILH